MAPEFFLFIACLFMSAFFSGSETALMSAGRLRLRRLAGEGDTRAEHVLDLIQDPRRLLAGILVGNNIFNVLAASAATSYFLRHFREGTGIVLATAITTVLLVLFSEFLPKTIAAMNPVGFSRRVAGPVRWALAVLSPAVIPLEALTRPLGAMLRRDKESLGLAELRIAVAEGVHTGAVDPAMARVLQGGLSLEWKTVADALIPRVDIASVDASAGYAACRDRFRQEKFSRLLVMDETPDNDLGYVAAKDLTKLDETDIEAWRARDRAREALRVPATLPLPRLLSRMRKSGVHFAVVKDEYGGTEGIVTLEDLLEELVGEIRDEHDPEEVPSIVPVGRDAWVVRGDASVNDLRDKIAIRLDAEGARTVGGFVAEELGRVPAQGDVIEREGYRLTVEFVQEKRVRQVRIERT